MTIDSSEGNVCSQIAEVACHNLYACCTESEIEDFLSVTERQTEDQCRQDLERSCDRQIAALRYSYDQKRVKFDANVMNNCLAALAAPSGTCAEVLPELPWAQACMGTAWVGTVAPEGECLTNNECLGSPDAYCAPNQVCKARPGYGEPCGQGCSHEFYCLSNVCQPRLAAGAACTSTTQCEAKLFCDTSQTMPTCTVPQPAGAACTSDLGCASKDCIPGACSGPFGTTCYKDTDCSGRCADDGSSCTQDGQCALGTCQLGGFSCSTPTSCGVGDTCIFPVACVPGSCEGEPVCSIARVTVDYCQGALSSIPVL